MGWDWWATGTWGQTGRSPVFRPILGMSNNKHAPEPSATPDLRATSAKYPMGRFARVVAVDVPHHVTQRGNARQVILDSDEDRVTYLALLRQYSELHGLE